MPAPALCTNTTTIVDNANDPILGELTDVPAPPPDILDAASMTDAGIPSEPTIRRMVGIFDANQCDLPVYVWMRLAFTTIRGRRTIACDGRTVRGAKDKDGNQPHLGGDRPHQRHRDRAS